MNRRRWVLLALAWAAASMAFAQRVGTWKNYTSMKDVQSVARAGTSYWAATGGGLFGWREGSSDFQRLTNAEGLQSTSLTAVAVDADGAVWSGSSTGYVHVYNPSTGALQVIRDITVSSQTNKQINEIVAAGDTMLICTDFGLSTFRRKKFEFGDTFIRFGTIPAGTPVSVRCAIIAGGRLWAGITGGKGLNFVASAPLNGSNLLDPAAWRLDPLGASGPLPTSLAVAAGRLWAGSGAGLFFYQGAGWSNMAAFDSRTISALAGSPTRLYLTTTLGEVFAVDSSTAFSQVGPALPFTPTSLTLSTQGTPVAGSLQGGILTLESAWSSHVPNGPNANPFASLVVDANGVLWAASGPTHAWGLYRFDGKTWNSFSTANSALPVNDVYRVSVACNGSVWASTFGGGLIEFPGGVNRLDTNRVVNASDGLVGVSNDPKFVVGSNVVCDGQGNTWLSVDGPADKNLLHVRRPDGRWVHLPVIYNGVKLANLTEDAVDRVLAVDGQDNLWGVARDPAYRGVVCLQNQGTIDSVAHVFLNSGSGLPSDEVKTIIVDRDNSIWVGTDRGIGIILDPSNPTANGAIAAYKPLLGTTVNTIAVDPLNQKWVGTPEGVVVLSPDGTQQLASYTVENTGGRLIDNNVRTITVDPGSGTVYFGTASGLASLTTTAAAPVETASKLKIYPNPYRLPSDVPLTIDGLRQDSRIKVLTASGALVRDLRTPGGRIGFWDGKDEQGTDVASGVYFIVGYTEDGSVVTGKVAVLKK